MFNVITYLYNLDREFNTCGALFLNFLYSLMDCLTFVHLAHNFITTFIPVHTYLMTSIPFVNSLKVVALAKVSITGELVIPFIHYSGTTKALLKFFLQQVSMLWSMAALSLHLSKNCSLSTSSNLKVVIL